MLESNIAFKYTITDNEQIIGRNWNNYQVTNFVSVDVTFTFIMEAHFENPTVLFLMYCYEHIKEIMFTPNTPLWWILIQIRGV